jgi:hypothetical protein
VTGAPDSLTPQLQSIQDHVFTPVCTTCHSGAAAPLGLRLDAGSSYAMLVNAPSVEVPALKRVAPGNPDASYLIQKLEGTAASGSRMPLNGPALAPATIAVIRQWIADGAPASSINAPQAPLAKVMAVWPPHDTHVVAPPREVVLSSNVELDTTLLSAGILTLRRSGGDADFTNGNERTLSAAITVRSLEPTVLAVSAPTQEWADDHYELRISGGPPLALSDRNSRAIDGDRDGTPGGDFVLRFTVGSPK